MAVNTSSIYTDNEILASDHVLTMLFQRCYCIGSSSLNIFNAEKSVGGHVKKFITSSFFKESNFIWRLDVKRFSK